MKQYIFVFYLFSSLFSFAQEQFTRTTSQSLKSVGGSATDDLQKYKYLLEYVNPFIGTGGHGHTYPGASAPFGMMQLSPDTRYKGWDGCSGYHYSDSVIYGFSHTHLSGTGVEDYCDVLIVPQTGELKTTAGYLDKNGYGSTFSHTNEKASPGYYALSLDNGINAEFTVSQRAGIHHYTFPDNGKKRYILIDLTHRDKLLKHSIKQTSPSEFEGARISSSWAKEQHVYFYMQTSVNATNVTSLDNNTKMVLEFPSSVSELELRVGISAVDEAGASLNYKKEIGEMNFQEVKSKTEQSWINELHTVTVESSDKNQLINFYTALYHSYLAPNVFSDVNGKYRGLDGKIHQANENNQQYTVFSLWDTYRATHPWHTIFQKARTIDFIRSFENQFLHSGELPVWELAGNETYCMIGYHSASVIADAYVKGIKQIDVPLFINALQTTANQDKFGKTDFNKNGFIGYKNEPESVSKSLEYSYDSYCIYTFLKEAEKDGFKVSDSLINVFYIRSFNFINNFDPQTGFMRARNGGVWQSPFKPEEVNFNFTEANSWQYSLYAPHAIPVLTQLLGGKDGLEKWLDNLFAASSDMAGNNQADITGLIGQYAHGNEPSHHMAYLYNYTNSPEKTAIIVDSILHHYYHNAPDGLSGNEDCGQMSSWFTFSSLGLYPVSPGSGIYDFGRPIFNAGKLRLENGQVISINVINNSPQNKFIQSIKINGKPYQKRYIHHTDLEHSGTIELLMGPAPSAEYRNYEIAPSINSLPDNFVSVPYFNNQSTAFKTQTTIEIAGLDKNVVYYYTLDGSIPTIKSKKYTKPFVIKQTTQVQAVAYNPKTQQYSPIISNEFRLKPEGVSLTLNSKYASQYAASGEEALIDGLLGTSEYRCGDWQGFYHVDVEGNISFSKPKQLKKIGLSALQSIGSWIFPPKAVEYIIHYNDLTIEEVSIKLDQHPTSNEARNKPVKFEYQPKNKSIKKIEFKAINYGVNPDWHVSPGYKTFIFMDEIYFE